MARWFLVAAVSAVLVAALAGWEILFAVGAVSTIVGTVAMTSAPRRLLVVFWVWLNLMLLALLVAPIPEAGGERFWGLPFSLLTMLGGIWLLPVLLWPLGFYLTFRSWLKE